jgi:hypothetical protein
MLRHVTLALLILMYAGAAGAADDLWAPFRPLEGSWQGEGEDLDGTSLVSHTWEFVVKGAFLALHTDARGEGTVHEDVGFLSRDRDRGRWMFRQFMSEGFVNTFEVVPGEENGLPAYDFLFVAAESAGDMKVRMRLVFTAADAYVMTLELAGGDGGYAACQTTKMMRFVNGTH